MGQVRHIERFDRGRSSSRIGWHMNISPTALSISWPIISFPMPRYADICQIFEQKEGGMPLATSVSEIYSILTPDTSIRKGGLSVHRSITPRFFLKYRFQIFLFRYAHVVKEKLKHMAISFSLQDRRAVHADEWGPPFTNVNPWNLKPSIHSKNIEWYFTPPPRKLCPWIFLFFSAF